MSKPLSLKTNGSLFFTGEPDEADEAATGDTIPETDLSGMMNPCGYIPNRQPPPTSLRRRTRCQTRGCTRESSIFLEDTEGSRFYFCCYGCYGSGGHEHDPHCCGDFCPATPPETGPTDLTTLPRSRYEIHLDDMQDPNLFIDNDESGDDAPAASVGQLGGHSESPTGSGAGKSESSEPWL